MTGRPAKKKGAGRPPAAAGEVATERVELRLTPSQLAAWTELVEREGLGSIKALVVAAVDRYAARDEHDDLAELGRQVRDLVTAGR